MNLLVWLDAIARPLGIAWWVFIWALSLTLATFGLWPVGTWRMLACLDR